MFERKHAVQCIATMKKTRKGRTGTRENRLFRPTESFHPRRTWTTKNTSALVSAHKTVFLKGKQTLPILHRLLRGWLDIFLLSGHQDHPIGASGSSNRCLDYLVGASAKTQVYYAFWKLYHFSSYHTEADFSRCCLVHPLIGNES